MAWVTPSNQSTGDLVTAAIWNQNVVANVIAARTHALLVGDSGTDTNSSAANVDTIAISGLTALDTLLVVTNIASVTQTTATPMLYSTTDSVKISDLVVSAGNLTAGSTRINHHWIRPYQSAATACAAIGHSADGVMATNATLTTAWTGSWTLALRHGGVTAGGTFQWKWTVYRVIGQ